MMALVVTVGCGHPQAVATTTTEYLIVKDGRRAWPIDNQALVRNLELALARQGFDPGRFDGVADARLARTLVSFQRSRGLDDDGTLDEATARALGLRFDRVRAEVRAFRLEPL